MRLVSENARHGTGLGIKVVPAPKPKPAEDVPGVPTAAWARVKRGVPASDPFKPGAGFMLMVDGARFLPGTACVMCHAWVMCYVSCMCHGYT